MASASLRIPTFYLGIVILGLFPAGHSRADEVTEISSEKEIEARAYDLKTIRPSRSGRVYLFQKSEEGFPVDGKIFLLRKGDAPVMAFRVLKTYLKTKQIAAKKLLPYEGYPSLERGSEFRAYEKVGDKVRPVPPSPEDLKDLQELESGSPEELPSAPPAELPSTPSAELPSTPPAELATPPVEVPPPPAEETTPVPPPVEEPPPASAKFEPPPGDEEVEMKETGDDIVGDEMNRQYPNFFTLAVGALSDSHVPGPNPKFGGGVLYSRNFIESWAFEGGFYYYQSSGFDPSGNSVSTTIVPLMGNLRYHWKLADIWTAYVYGGVVYPLVSTTLGATKTDLAAIRVPSPAFGAGVFLQTGPNWYVRANLGYESVTLGVTLRY